MPAQNYQTSVIDKKEGAILVCPVLEQQFRRHEGRGGRSYVVFGIAGVRLIHRWLVEDDGRVMKNGRGIHAGVMSMRMAEQGCGGCRGTEKTKVCLNNNGLNQCRERT